MEMFTSDSRLHYPRNSWHQLWLTRMDVDTWIRQKPWGPRKD